MTKNVPIYVYYLTVEKHKSSDDTDSKYDMAEIVSALSDMLDKTSKLPLIDRRTDSKTAEKVIWLDRYEDLKNGNYNLVFKSAKYNHVRDEIDTDTMEPLGRRKRPQDGDEERTHLIIRLAAGELRFLTVHESNHYGLTIKSIVDYLNERFEKINEESEDGYYYKASYEIVPSEAFLTQLKQAKRLSVLRLEVDREALKDDFLALAGRNEVKETVEIVIKRSRGTRDVPENLIKAYYDDMQSGNRIRKITVEGTGNVHNPMNISTDLVKMKHCLTVECEDVTNEVKSFDFFSKAQDFIDERRK